MGPLMTSRFPSHPLGVAVLVKFDEHGYAGLARVSGSARRETNWVRWHLASIFDSKCTQVLVLSGADNQIEWQGDLRVNRNRDAL